MSARRRLPLLLLAAAAFVAALFILQAAGLPGQYQDGLRPVAPELYALAPDFEARSISGEQIDLGALRGSPVLINFWATWCGPCALEMPNLETIFESQRQRGLRVLAVNLGESSAEIAAWQQAYNLSYDLLIDQSQEIAALYHLRGQPSTYLVSPEGIITAIYFGPVQESTLLAALK